MSEQDSEQDDDELKCQKVDLSAEPWAQMLLRTPPKERTPEFTGPEGGWPPRVTGVTNLRQLPWESSPGELTESLEVHIRQAALKDERVCEVLGERFAHINTTVIDPGKQAHHHCYATRVTFFSYTHNRAVQVAMKGLRVDSVLEKDGYQPPEGADEIRCAIDIARNDSRLRDKVHNLQGKAILVYPSAGGFGAGHRVLYVTFTRPGGYHPVYAATIDLIDEKVLSTRHRKRK